MAGGIHPAAIVADGARIAPDVEIGPYSIVGPQVSIGEGSWIGAHVVLDGHLRIGRGNRIFHFASLGAPPQDKKYAGEPTTVEIGDGNTIREYVTINRGTAQDVGATRLGNDNWLMAYVHVAHDCQVGSHTIFANCTQLAGHVIVEDWVIFGGFTGVHQHVRVGAHSFTGIGTHLTQDLPPYITAAGEEGKPFGLNTNGLKRRGFSAEGINAIKRAYRTLYRSGLSLAEAKSELDKQAAAFPEVRRFLDFINNSERGIVR
ncbi:MAG TPA: acyl-ACP--UDP-N-acetylglucosamine O-acyltransferase [Burkholderiales bacterium]|jgi:UDP-N-acetylglucosamine acyltransferase